MIGENWQLVIECNLLDFQTLGYQLIMPKKSLLLLDQANVLLYQTIFVKKRFEFEYLANLGFLKQIIPIDFTWVFMISHTEANVLLY